MNKESDVLITVLMTVFNGKEYLAQAIESILLQTFTKIELLIINEYGSEDEATEIINHYAMLDKRIVVVQNCSRLGFAASLNKGISLARGKYIARMDTDDISVPKRLEWQYSFMEKHPDVLLSGGNIRYMKNDQLMNYRQKYLHRASQIRMSMLFICEFSHPTVIFNKKFLLQQGYAYDEEIKTEDYELWSRLVYREHIANIGKTLLYYRFHENNSINVQKNAVDESTKEVQQRIFERFGVAISLKNQILIGAYTNQQLDDIEQGFYELLSKYPAIFNNKEVFRNRMDVVYRNTEKNMECTLRKHKRYWEKFGELYGWKKKFLQVIDRVVYFGKDILWKLMIE